jgi:hypothetical protein
MITTIIFSRDRAMQLDLLLESLDRNGARLFSPAYVLYRATDADHERAYRICRDRYPSVILVPDGVSSFRLVARLSESADFACFFTDDSVLYRALMSPLPLDALRDSRLLCFSLRLGRNTTWCYPHGRAQSLPVFEVSEVRGSPTRGALVWDWVGAAVDFGYPASVDGHVFRGATLRPALYDCPVDASPNQVEDHLVRALAADRRLMASYPESCLVGLPLNIVTETHSNRHGEAFPFSADELLGRYLDGQRIALDRLDFSDVRGAHQEIELVFE